LPPPPTPAPVPPPAAPKFAADLTIVNVFSGVGIAGVTLQGTGLILDKPSSGSGLLTVASDEGGARDVTFAGPSLVARTTQLRLPGDAARVTLIPADFDLVAFDQFCRQPAIHRWRTPPTVTAEARVLQFTSLADGTMPGSTTVDSDSYLRQVAADMESALSDLTGGRWTSFDAINVQHSGEGAAVPIMVSGRITVARVSGMYAASGFGGYTRWEINASGEVVSASILLDTQFDNPTGPYATALRIHEFGHALGLTHVTARASVMNPSATTGPTPFDRDAAKLLWQRPIGNQSPDNDPSGAGVNRAGRSYWTAGEGSRPGR